MPTAHAGARRLLHRGLRVLLLSVALPAGAGAQAPASPAADTLTGAIAGTVSNADDGTPIPFALVRVVEQSDTATTPRRVLRQAISNASGRFHLGGLPAAT